MLIRDLNQLSEMQAVEDLQKEIWGVEDREILPALAMIPVTKVGGLLLGAFDADELIGFAFAFPGVENHRLILHSDMLAVKPAYRSHGIGYQLKLAQRRRALEEGIDTITWTFDPLQSLNARLNFGKLGVVSDKYYKDFYGETTSFLHSTGTDRLWVTWPLNAERVAARIAGTHYSAPSEPPKLVTVGDQLEPISSDLNSSNQHLIEIPSNINAVSEDDPMLAGRWRLATRNAFTNALAKGFVVEEFDLVSAGEQQTGRYLLVKRNQGNLAAPDLDISPSAAGLS